MSDELPKLPDAEESERPNPLARYLTQQLTRLVPRQKIDDAESTTSSWWTPTRARWSVAIGAGLLLVLIISLAGSSDTNAASEVGGEDWLDDQLEVWRDAKLAPGGFATVEPSALGAAECHSGAAAALELTLCRFATAASAADAVTLAEKSIGKHTGVVVAKEDRLLIIADRRSADPSGRTINQLAKTFR